MGSSVINNIESNSVVVGSPSKFLRRTIKNWSVGLQMNLVQELI
jgi:hypothetical protein